MDKLIDGNLPNSEQYLITYLPDTGGMIAHRIRHEDNGHWQTFGHVAINDLPFGPALILGEKTIALAASEFCSLAEPQVMDCADDGGYLAVEIRLTADKPVEHKTPDAPKGEKYVNSWSEQWAWMRQTDRRLKALEGAEDKPAQTEKTGLAYLMSLPKWTIIKPENRTPVLILSDGFQYMSGDTWKWSSLSDRKTSDWIGLASPKTCPEWTPKKT